MKSKTTKQLKKIEKRTVQGRILTATRGLADFPICSNVKRLTNHEYTHPSLRVGDWRILFNVFEEISIASMEEVKKRDESTH